ncbi:anti-sigma factor [Pelagibius sp.]|uniref:anti-sigma factor family protein n=1 Tax=Pelagibius sp. TaxID=1931238 RepID=UPI00262390AE|nr:anti-sigma factor [Pelagibius sp.]
MSPTGREPPQWQEPPSGNDNSVSEEDLQAYVDGLLPAADRARIEAYLALRADESERLAAYRKQNIGLHGLFDSSNDGSGSTDDLDRLPPQMAMLAQQLDGKLRAAAPRRSYSRPLRSLAAALAVMITAGGAGWLTYEQFFRPTDPLVAFTQQAAEAHARLAERQLAGSENGGRQVVTWLSEQPEGAPLRVPDLESLGFQLVAERVTPGANGQRAAQLLYQDEDGERISLFMRAGRSNANTSFTFTREGEASQFFWRSGSFAYSLIGMMEQKRLLEIAEVISEELQKNAADAEAGAKAPGPGEAVSATIAPAITPADTVDGSESDSMVPKPAGTAETGPVIEPPAETAPAKPELMPLPPLPTPLPESDSVPKDT